MSGEAWDLANEAASRAGVRIVALDGPGDVDLVNEVIRTVWGEQLLPPEVMRALQHAGCVLLGAREQGARGEVLAGFVFGFMGFEGGFHLHSHMLAVLPELQAHGVGFALKAAQRAACLDHGIDEVRWTYDPLVARNGWFNLMKLGATADRFHEHFYGDMRDVLNRGDRSDRFEVVWRLGSGRVRRALSGEGGACAVDVDRVPSLLEADGDPVAPEPRLVDGPPGHRALVAVPADHFGLRQRDPDLAGRWRVAAGRAFRSCMDAGMVATAITRDGRYLFEHPSADPTPDGGGSG